MFLALIFFSFFYFSIVDPTVAKEIHFVLNNNFLKFTDLQGMQTASAKTIEIKQEYRWPVSSDQEHVSISFEYLIETAEDLLAFDEPAFLLILTANGEKNLIFAQKKGRENSWQAVTIDLTLVAGAKNELIFKAGNLGDQEKLTRVYLRKLAMVNETLPNKKTELRGFQAIREFDGSLTLVISPDVDFTKSNATWWLSCGAAEPRQLIVTNHYLLANYKIQDFWSNYGDKILINIFGFSCSDLSLLRLERR